MPEVVEMTDRLKKPVRGDFMVFDKIMEFIVAPVTWLINLFPAMDFSFSPTVLADIMDLFRALGYVIPWAGLLPILTASILLLSFRLTWTIILRLKSFIPTLGGT